MIVFGVVPERGIPTMKIGGFPIVVWLLGPLCTLVEENVLQRWLNS